MVDEYEKWCDYFLKFIDEDDTEKTIYVENLKIGTATFSYESKSGNIITLPISKFLKSKVSIGIDNGKDNSR